MNTRMDEAINYATQKCGFNVVRENQKKMMTAFLNGFDGIYVAPTGSGKSFLFITAVFARHFMDCMDKSADESPVHGTVIVVSPLVSLMKSQVESIKQRGISAAYIKASSEPTGYNAIRCLPPCIDSILTRGLMCGK